VTERLMTASNGNAVAHRAGHVLFGTSCRFVQRITERQPRGDRGGKRATGAMRVRHGESRLSEYHLVMRVHQQID
jgi:hypothetical protein